MSITRGICIALVALLGSVSEAATLTVPDDVASIQEAIDAAAPGDTVLVKAGEYSEPITLKSGVHLKGEEPGTVILGDAIHAAVKAEQCEEVTLEDLTFSQPPGVEAPDPDTPICPIGVIRESRVRVLECVFEGGGASGLGIEGVGNVEIRGTVFRDNARNGLYVEKQATVIMHRCDMMSNGLSGVVAKDPETRVTVEYSTCSANDWAGMYVHNRGILRVDRCRAIDNTGYGICVLNIKSSLDVKNSTMTGNTGSGIYVEIGSDVTLAGNEYDPNGEINEGEIQAILRADDFAALETIGERLREGKVQFSSGGRQSDTFYEGLIEGCSFMNGPQEAEHLKRLERWKAAYPDSLSWRFALACSDRRFGWRDRGPGFAMEVTTEGWKKFREYLGEAQAVLDEMKNLAAREPKYYELLIEQAREYQPETNPVAMVTSMLGATLGIDRRDAMRRAFDEGVAVDREYFPLYHTYAWGLLPRWGGTPAKYVAFAEEADAMLSDIPGTHMYAYLAKVAYGAEGEEVFLSRYDFSWDRIRENFERSQTHWPESTYASNGICRFACVYSDREEAARQFEKLGDSWDGSVWHCNAQYVAWRRWALEGAPKPGDSDAARAAKSGSVSSLQAALDAGGDPNGLNEDGHTLLQGAILDDKLDNHLEIARVLLKNGADPNLTLEGATPNIHIAVEMETDEFLKLLLEHGANPDTKKDGWSALTIAMNRNKPDMAKLLLDHGADPNLVSGIGTPPIIIAIYKRFGGVVAKLLERGADVNARSEMGATPLMRAVYDVDLNMLTFLFEKGADPNIPTFTGYTNLMTAADNENLIMARLLVEKGAQVDYINVNGWTAIHQAAGVSKTDVLRYFLELKPEGVNTVSKEGMSVLQYAVENGQLDAVKLLVEQGADVNHRNPKNQLTALGYAVLGKHQAIHDFLKQHGAEI